MASQYKGLFVASHTPMDSKRELVLDLVPKYVEWLHKNKVDGVYAIGSTGEFPHLTIEERKKLQKKWIQCAEGKLKVIVQVGANNIKDTLELAKDAVANGAKALAVVPPFYFPLSNPESCVQLLETIAAAVPNTDLFYYHIQFTTNVGYSLYDLLSAARTRVPTLVGAKFTDYDTAQLMRCTELRTLKGEPFVILPGFEDTYLINLAAGGDGLVGAQVNFMPREFVALKEAFDRGDFVAARKHQLRIIHAKEAITKFTKETGQDIFSGLKDAMRVVGRRQAGFDVGPARQPLLSASESKLSALEAAFDAMGFFTW